MIDCISVWLQWVATIVVVIVVRRKAQYLPIMPAVELPELNVADQLALKHQNDPSAMNSLSPMFMTCSLTNFCTLVSFNPF